MPSERRGSKTKRRSIAHKTSTQHMSKQCTYTLDDRQRPKMYGQQLEDGFTAVNPDIW